MIKKKAWSDYPDTAIGVREATADMISADDARRERERKRLTPARLEGDLGILPAAVGVRL